MSVKKTQAIKNLLVAFAPEDLAALYNPDMEVHVNVTPMGGERVDGDYKGKLWHGYTDGMTTWKPFRIPYNANTEPTFDDSDINFDLAKYYDAIGCTGWNWRSRLSNWVGFDFDAIIGHSDRHEKKLTSEELDNIRQLVESIPWVTIRTSTSGKGLHLYVFVKPVPTANHNEHAALARAILGQMSLVAGFDFKAKVDSFGHVLWLHRRNRPVDGLQLIKQGVLLEDIPSNWRDHLKVVSGKRRKIVPSIVEGQDSESLFEEITAQKAHVRLDAEHKKLLDFLQSNNASWSWDQDNRILITHTVHLKEAYTKLELRGLFETVAKGTEYGHDQNCFAFATKKGSWAVYRYSPGVGEAVTWTQDANGYTKCFLNRDIDFETAVKYCGGIEHKSGGYVFQEAKKAYQVLKLLGINSEQPVRTSNRQAKLKKTKEGKVLIELLNDPTDRDEEFVGFVKEKKTWDRVFNPDSNQPEIEGCDDSIRHLITESLEDAGWYIKVDAEWHEEPLIHVRAYLQSLGFDPKEVTMMIGLSVGKCFKIVNKPFQAEYLGDRIWNKNSAQYRFVPSQDLDNLQFPTWQNILTHCGKGLDDAISRDEWCIRNELLSGRDYLACWIASLFQKPSEPLPYLFFYSKKQATGKSIFHEAIKLLITKGVTEGNNALLSESRYNGELENSVLCYIEETDLRKNKAAYSLIKQWVTSQEIMIHPKYVTPYAIKNTIHFVHAANDQAYCPIFEGDTRITMINVPPLDPEKIIPKRLLLPKLEKEAPDFLAYILNLELPYSNDRLNIPVIDSEEKTYAARANKTDLEIFCEDHLHHVTGKRILFTDFYTRFIEWLDPNELANWSKIKVGREIPEPYIKGRSPKDLNKLYILNASFSVFRAEDPVLDPLRTRDGNIIE